jgi:acetate---CoA ligase (ADP-forming)
MSDCCACTLGGIFDAKSIAVVGASTRPGTAGNDIFRNLLSAGFQGKVYPVNPKATHVEKIEAYPSLTAIPDEVDLVVVIVPSKVVLNVVDEAIEKGVKGFVVISAGFKETGKEGAELEKQLAAKVKAAGIPLIGPNCLGIINTDPEVSMNATFGRKMPAAGNLAFISQSGALCTSVLDYAESRGMGFSKFVSFGNKADVNEITLLQYLANDDKTDVVAMYLEDVTDGPKFMNAVRDIFWKTGKPMLCLKSGRSAEGAKAVSSHTGSLAGSDKVYDALLIQSGVQRVETIAELFDYAALYTKQPMPKGNRLAIITNAGGPGIMATDAAIRNDLKLAVLSEETKDKMRDALPATASLSNPVDVIGDARSDRYQAAIRTVLEDPEVDMGLVILTPQSMTDIEDIASIVAPSIKGIDKPVVSSFMGVKDVADGVEILSKSGVPNYAFPEDAVKSLAAAYCLTSLREIPDRVDLEIDGLEVEKATKIIAETLGDKDEKYLSQADCRSLFECYGLPLLKSETVTTADDAAKVASDWGVPVVMKVMSSDVKHKFDAGGVLLNIDGPDAARDSFNQIYANVEAAIPGAKIDSILVEEMAAKGVEVILGSSRNPGFGPLMMFGLGGTLVEVLKDVTFRLAPMWKVSAEKMVREIRAFQVLDGFRGTPKADVDSIVDTMLRLSALVCNHPEVVELDINPLIVHPVGKGSSVADSRVMLRKPE